ncbi:hypothetical protein Lnau_2346 [Legionella nautarum]|uniref:Uncharacterized protein n=1 Tax=Legionella nautarum TaxID=45070 RepID=A0A0W0WMN3_9GAMM|nr:hypothetical protein Lnau_2346 [Legionella nautarum]
MEDAIHNKNELLKTANNSGTPFYYYDAKIIQILFNFIVYFLITCIDFFTHLKQILMLQFVIS